jgi:hypothetical protein
MNQNSKETIVLPISESYLPNSSSIVYKAKNGDYTYQIFAICYPFKQEQNWASLSVFNNGVKTRHSTKNNYNSDQGWCNDMFSQ